VSFGNAQITVKYNHFDRIARTYPKKVGQVCRKTGNDIIRSAAPNTPVETGFLRTAVTIVAFTDLLIGVFWSAFYAIYQELGTRHIAGKFFATKAAEANRQPFIDAIKAIDML
jgi:hypothetical protein